MSNPEVLNICNLLGLQPSSNEISTEITRLSRLVDVPDAGVPTVKSYPDAVYFNYFALGISLLFSPKNGYKPTMGLERARLDEKNLLLESIDIYNLPKSKATTAGVHHGNTSELSFSTYPVSPFVIPSAKEQDKDNRRLEVSHHTTGKEFVGFFGEPDRKGGGAGPSTGSIGIWCEWSKDGVMVEFGGNEARGPQAWETGKDAVWRVITVFPRK